MKSEIHYVRVTIGGDRLEYDGFKSTVLAILTTVKIHLNSVISTLDTQYCTIDIKYFFYGTPMKDFEYGHLPLNLLPDEIIQQYNLLDIAQNDKVYFEIRKRIPGLKQAGIIAHERLSKYLNKFGYKECQYTPSLWKHESLPISFMLVVDDLRVKFVNKNLAQHLIETLQKLYLITVDWSGTKYLGLDID